MKGYSKYRETGLPWLPHIPAHWAWRMLSQTGKEQQIRNLNDHDYPVLSLSYGNIIRKKNIELGLVPSNYDNYQIVHAGNIILRLTDLQNDHKSLRTGLVQEDGIITSAYTCIKSTENPAFIHYVLHVYDMKKIFYGMGGGVRQSIAYKDIRNMMLPVPPREEQDQIACYLDWQSSRINKQINAKKKQITLLELLKQKVIDDLLPHEGNCALGRLIVNIESGTSVNSESGSAQEKDFGILATSCVYGNVFHVEENKKVIESEHSRVKCNVREGTLIISRMNTPSLVGSCGYSKKTYPNIYLPDRLWQVTLKSSLLPEFAWRYLSSSRVQSWFASIATGSSSTMKNITKGQLRALMISCPSVKEQQAIVDNINKQEIRIQCYVDCIKRQVALLEEYCACLITEVVTGQIDVRDVTVPNRSKAEGASQ